MSYNDNNNLLQVEINGKKKQVYYDANGIKLVVYVKEGGDLFCKFPRSEKTVSVKVFNKIRESKSTNDTLDTDEDKKNEELCKELYEDLYVETEDIFKYEEVNKYTPKDEDFFIKDKKNGNTFKKVDKLQFTKKQGYKGFGLPIGRDIVKCDVFGVKAYSKEVSIAPDELIESSASNALQPNSPAINDVLIDFNDLVGCKKNKIPIASTISKNLDKYTDEENKKQVINNTIKLIKDHKSQLGNDKNKLQKAATLLVVLEIYKYHIDRKNNFDSFDTIYTYLNKTIEKQVENTTFSTTEETDLSSVILEVNKVLVKEDKEQIEDSVNIAF